MVVISILILLLINAAYSATIVLITKNTAKFPQAPSRASSNNIRSGGYALPSADLYFRAVFRMLLGRSPADGPKKRRGRICLLRGSRSRSPSFWHLVLDG